MAAVVNDCILRVVRPTTFLELPDEILLEALCVKVPVWSIKLMCVYIKTDINSSFSISRGGYLHTINVFNKHV